MIIEVLYKRIYLYVVFVFDSILNFLLSFKYSSMQKNAIQSISATKKKISFLVLVFNGIKYDEYYDFVFLSHVGLALHYVISMRMNQAWRQQCLQTLLHVFSLCNQ